MPTQAPQQMPGMRADAGGASDEQTNMMRLQRMRDRLASLSNEARTIRSQVPNEFEPDVERIQKQMSRLGERLAELGASATLHPAGVEPGSETQALDEVIVLGGPAKQGNPWDEVSANALTRFYESGEAYFGDTAFGGQAASSNERATDTGSRRAAESNAVGVDSAWLDQRFVEVARHIEQQLAQMHPENSLLTIGRRFDQLEDKMASALRGVATRADLEHLRGAEAQIEQINGQLEQFRNQLGRLDAIDAHLGNLADQLSEEKLKELIAENSSTGPNSRLEAIDAHLGTLISQLSQERLAEIAGQSADMRAAQSRDLGEVRGLIESLISERRHNDENNASMLETMQQAIIRVLDRIDALEHGQPGAQAPAAEMSSMPMDQSQPGYEQQEEPRQPEPAYEIPQTPAFGDAREELSFDPQPQDGFATAPFDLEAAFATERDRRDQSRDEERPSDRNIEALRQDFIADAHRAKLKAASKSDSSAQPSLAAMGDGAGEPEEKPRKRRSFFSFKSPRALMTVLTLLAVVPAALFFMPRTPVDGSAVPASGSTISSPQDRMGTGDGVGPASIDENAPTVPFDTKRTEQLPFGFQPDAGRFEDAGQSQQHMPSGRVDTAALPDGITSDPDAEPAAQRLMRRYGAGEAAATRPSNGRPQDETPAAQMRDRVLRQHGITGGAQSLPPAMVGPFSLRLAAAKGEPSAQFEVGMRLAEGKGAEQDLKQASVWLRRSAESGFAMAQFRLGTLYERGIGEKKDLAEAQLWYARAAEQGNVKAMHNLAVLIASGSDKDPDYATAGKWFTAAAERGLSDSQFNLAVLHENGLGMPRDDKEAYKWLILASKSGDAEAEKRRDLVKARLNAEDRAEVEAVVQSWLPRPADPAANDSRVAGQVWQKHRQSVTRG